MHNLGFVADEKFPVVREVMVTCKGRCVAFYTSGQGLRTAGGGASQPGAGCECVPGSCKTTVPVYGKTNPKRQPIPHNMSLPLVNSEESTLLGVMTQDNLDDIMTSVPLPMLRTNRSSDYWESRVSTNRGQLLVAVQGHRANPAIITYHDIGLNHLCFQAFFNYTDMKVMLENFCVYHVTAPGQEEGAPAFPDDYIYPDMDELANQLHYVLTNFGIRTFIGIGVGAGANILTRFALANPEKVEALTVINCSSSQAGWIEWAYQKMNSRSLRARGMTHAVLDYLMWHHFGRYAEERNHDLTQLYRIYFTRHVNPTNLALFIDSYIRRTSLAISRQTDSLKVPVLNITGAMSPHVEETVTFNGRLQPRRSTWMKISDCAMVLEEQPGKISEAFRLFLQGEGIVAPLSPTKVMASRRLPDGGRGGAAERRRACAPSPVIRITENPISETVVC